MSQDKIRYEDEKDFRGGVQVGGGKPESSGESGAIADLIELAEEAIGYVSDHFREKWNMHERLAKLKTATREQTSQTTNHDAGSEATPLPEMRMSEAVMDSTPAAPPSGEGPYKVEQGVSNHDGATVYSVVGPGGIERAEYMTRMMPDWWAVELNKAFAAGQATQSPRSERIEVAAGLIDLLNEWLEAEREYTRSIEDLRANHKKKAAVERWSLAEHRRDDLGRRFKESFHAAALEQENT